MLFFVLKSFIIIQNIITRSLQFALKGNKIVTIFDCNEACIIY